jgi:hypothetical protein
MFEYNKVYVRELDIASDELPNDVLYSLLADGRVASHFLEKYLEVWFPELKCVDQKGYDHILLEDFDKFKNGSKDYKKFDQKCFTKGGLRFMPSGMIGVGRTFEKEEAHRHAKDIIYICCDVLNLPEVSIVFKKGSDLLNMYENCHVPYRDRETFFEI